jgi:hypothetical protein
MVTWTGVEKRRTVARREELPQAKRAVASGRVEFFTRAKSGRRNNAVNNPVASLWIDSGHPVH